MGVVSLNTLVYQTGDRILNDCDAPENCIHFPIDTDKKGVGFYRIKSSVSG
jgi:hypothetical protein